MITTSLIIQVIVLFLLTYEYLLREGQSLGNIELP